MIAFILACYGVLVYQLYVWQVRDAESYRAEAVTQQLKDTTLPAVRGSIYSANGKLLAKSSTVWNIVADPSSILESGATEDQIRTAAEHIAELLGDGTTADTVYKALTASNKDTGEPYQYRVVKKGVEKPVADAILAYADSYRLKVGAAVDTSQQTEEMEDKKDYEVNFTQAGKKWSAKYTADAKWLETEHAVKLDELPRAVRSAIATNYADHKVEDAELVESPQGTTYEVDLEKGEHSMEVVFSADGKVLKSAMEEDDEKDEGTDEKD